MHDGGRREEGSHERVSHELLATATASTNRPLPVKNSTTKDSMFVIVEYRINKMSSNGHL